MKRDGQKAKEATRRDEKVTAQRREILRGYVSRKGREKHGERERRKRRRGGDGQMAEKEV